MNMRLPGYSEQLARRCLKAEVLMDFAVKVADLQMEGKLEFLGENPWSSRAWATRLGRILLGKL